MTIGQTGMGDMGEMGMKFPRNAPDDRSPRPARLHHDGRHVYDIKIRDHLESYDKDPGWFEKPPGTLVTNATEEDMERDLGFIPAMEPGGAAPMKHEHHG